MNHINLMGSSFYECDITTELLMYECLYFKYDIKHAYSGCKYHRSSPHY